MPGLRGMGRGASKGCGAWVRGRKHMQTHMLCYGLGCALEYVDYIYGMVDFTLCNRHTCIIPNIQEHPVYLYSVYYVDNVYI